MSLAGSWPDFDFNKVCFESRSAWDIDSLWCSLQGRQELLELADLVHESHGAAIRAVMAACQLTQEDEAAALVRLLWHDGSCRRNILGRACGAKAKGDILPDLHHLIPEVLGPAWCR